MSELHYGKNVEWFLRELSAHEAGDIESAEIEVIGENDQGVEGFTTIDITLLAADAVSVISALQQKLDAVLAKGMELAKEAAHVYAEYNKEIAPDVTCDGQTIQEFHDLANGWSSVESYINEVRAEGVYFVANHMDSLQHNLMVSSTSLREYANQLRAGSTEGGV